MACRTQATLILEFYARVLSSQRGQAIQHFNFADLFYPEKPPYLEGSWTGWKGVECWEADGEAFLGDAGGRKMCRVIGKVERGDGGKWVVNIMSIWEASWEDVMAVKGVVCA